MLKKCYYMQIARVSHFGVERGWLVCMATDIQGVIGGPTNLSESCLWRHSIPYGELSGLLSATNPTDDNLWLS